MSTPDRMARIRLLMDKGVRMPLPDTVDIGPEVQLERISGNGVVLHHSSKMRPSDSRYSVGIVSVPQNRDGCQADHVSPASSEKHS